MITRPADGYINLEPLQSHEPGVLAWKSRSDTSLLKLNICVSDRFVILVTNYRWLGIMEVVRYRRSNRPILKNARQIYKIHSFINERDFDKMSLVINFRIDKWTESMLSITYSQR